MRIILHGVLAEQFGREHVILTDRPADAIEGLSRQLAGWPRDMVIDVIDHPTEHHLRAQTDVEEIHLVPAMFGGGGKWGTILLGAALIAASFAMPAAGIAFAGITLTSGMVFLMGAALVLTGVSQLFMKAPTFDKSNDPPPSKYLGINRNTTGVGTLLPNAAGRMKLSGHWLSLQSDANHLVTASWPVSLP